MLPREYILAINAGSSSVKMSLYSIDPSTRKVTVPEIQLESYITNINSPPPIFTYFHRNTASKCAELDNQDIKKQKLDRQFSFHDEAFEHFLSHLLKDPALPEVSSGNRIRFACHRIVHGGDFPTAETINEETYNYIEELTDLAPL